MSRLLLFLFICLLFSLSSFCTGPNIAVPEGAQIYPDTLLLKYQDTIFVENKNIRISFDTLISESRCPENVVCVWAGNANLGFTFFNEEAEYKFSLNTHMDYKRDATINGYKFTLFDVLPYQNTDSLFTENDYSAVIVISIKGFIEY